MGERVVEKERSIKKERITYGSLRINTVQIKLVCHRNVEQNVFWNHGIGLHEPQFPQQFNTENSFPNHGLLLSSHTS